MTSGDVGLSIHLQGLLLHKLLGVVYVCGKYKVLSLTQQRDRDMWGWEGRVRVWRNIGPGERGICKEEVCCQHSEVVSNSVAWYISLVLKPSVPHLGDLEKYLANTV